MLNITKVLDVIEKEDSVVFVIKTENRNEKGKSLLIRAVLNKDTLEFGNNITRVQL